MGCPILSLEELIDCAAREVERRKAEYAKTESTDYEIRCMQAILEQLKDMRRALP